MSRFSPLAILLAICSCTVDPTDAAPSATGDPQSPVDSVTVPTPPAAGISPCIGWPGGINGPAAYMRNGDGSVSFHGGIWTVPIAPIPGRALTDVTFTIEAPTGNIGDPANVLVKLYSMPSQALLGQVALQPGGVGVRVNSDLPLSPAYVVSPGETFELIFVPLNATGDGYAANDTKIDSIAVAPAGDSTWLPASDFVLTNGTATLADGVWTPNGVISLTRWEAPIDLPSGGVIRSVVAYYVRHGFADSTDSYSIRIRQRVVDQGTAVITSIDAASAQVNGAATSNYPNIDSLAISANLPIVVPSNPQMWLRFEFFENNEASGVPHAQFLGVKLN